MTSRMDKPSHRQFSVDMDAVFTLFNGQSISYRQFWRHVYYFSELLPRQDYLVNDCEDRYLFTVALFSAMLNASTTLLPPSKSSGILEELQRDYGVLCTVTDQPLPIVRADQLCIDFASLEQASQCTKPPESAQFEFDPRQPVLIAFTSGTTGRPKAQPKYWNGLIECGQRAIQCLGQDNQQRVMLSTTPAQHMFGLETSVLWPYLSALVMTNQRPFYPEDIRQTIQSMPYPVVLCSTPTHLRACVNTGGAWDNLVTVISSTAPLAGTLANQVESVMGVELYELFGSTETLSFASRRPTQQTAWTPYRGVNLQSVSSQTQLNASYLPQSVSLDDVFELLPGGQFEVTGRAIDLIKIGGKRASMTELNHRLQAISGVIDGCFFKIERSGAEQRLGIIVVSELSPETIITALRRHLDEVFLPRSVYYTQTLPRNRLGKIVDTELRLMIRQLRKSSIG